MAHLHCLTGILKIFLLTALVMGGCDSSEETNDTTSDTPNNANNAIPDTANNDMPDESNNAVPAPRSETTVQDILDVDGDGGLSAQELSNATSRLALLDIDQDGTLSPAESHGGPLEDPFSVRFNWAFNFVDLDGDITISEAEIANATTNLLEYDLDDDGQLGVDEFTTPPQMGPPGMPRPEPRNLEVAEGPLPPNGQDDRVYEGYIFFYGSYDASRVQVQNKAFLMNTQGEFVHEWTTDLYVPQGSAAYLMPNGNLVRAGAAYNWRELTNFAAGGNGVIEIVDWDSNVLWSFEYCQIGQYCLHHDFSVMPNGNILAITYDVNTPEQAAQYGWEGAPSSITGMFYTERIIEIEPNLATGEGRIVWEWDTRDHLVQDINPDLPNFGDVRTSKTKLNPNYDHMENPFYMGQIFHLNSIDYNAEFDQILLSSAMFGEVWVIDHATTTEQSRGNAGDLLYRYGNPRAIDPDTGEKTVLFWQHDVYWTGEHGQIQIFNNGAERDRNGDFDPDQMALGFLDGAYTDLLRLDMPVDDNGVWDWNAQPEVVWSYNSDGSEEGFYAPFMSGARTLPNGNVIAVQGNDNRVFEITEDGQRVLDFFMPVPGRMFRIEKLPPDYPGLSLP